MDCTHYPVVSLAELEELVLDTALSPRPRPTLALSDPGTGKTQTAVRIAQRIATVIPGYRYAPLELAGAPWEECSGVPVREGNGIVRFPLAPVRAWSEAPALGHLDEISRADAGKQGAGLTGTNERRWGDTPVHERTAFLLTGNKPESSGTYSVIDALLNRCCNVTVAVSREEKRAYLRGGFNAPVAPVRPLDPAVYWAEKARLLAQYADFSEGRSEMMPDDPPRGFAESGALWASGRAIEHAMERVAARIARGESGTDHIALTHVSGVIGRETGVLWHRLTELLGKLPTVKEIEKDPVGCKVPTDAESAVSALSLLKDLTPDALWIWLGRWEAGLAEVQAAGAKRATGRIPTAGNARAIKSMNALSASINRALTR
jgi:hypothetical protein